MIHVPHITRVCDKILLLLAVRKMFGVPTDRPFLTNYLRDETMMDEALGVLSGNGLITITPFKKVFYELTDKGIEEQSTRISLLLNRFSLD